MIDLESRMLPRYITAEELEDFKRMLISSHAFKHFRVMLKNRATAEALNGKLKRAGLFEEISNFSIEDLEHSMEEDEVFAPQLVDLNPRGTGVGTNVTEP